MSLFKKKMKTSGFRQASEYIQSSTKILNLIKEAMPAEEIMNSLCYKGKADEYVKQAFLDLNRKPLTMLGFDAEGICILSETKPDFVKEHHLEEMVEYAKVFDDDFVTMCYMSFTYQYLKAKGIDIKDSSPIPMNQAPFVAYLSPAIMLNVGPAKEYQAMPPEKQAAEVSDIWKNTLWYFDNFIKDNAPYKQITKDMDVYNKYKKFAYNDKGQFCATDVICKLTKPDEFEKQCRKCKIDLTPVSEKEQGIQK